MDLLFKKDFKTPDGQLFNPQLFKKLVNDCYIISKVIHTSYNDVLQITPAEKNYLLAFIKQDNDNSNKKFQEQLNNMRNNNNNR